MLLGRYSSAWGGSLTSRFLIFTMALLASVFVGIGFAVADQLAPQTFISKVPTPQTKTKAMWGPASINGKSQFPVYRDLGVGIYQMGVAWNDIAPTQPVDPTNPADPAYQWPASIQETLTEAKSDGMKCRIYDSGAPPWDN